jgi:gas vesicle protein
MGKFILGVIVGAVAALFFMRSEYAQDLEMDARLDEFQDRANGVLNESRRLLEETRDQLSQMRGGAQPGASQSTEM